MSLAAVREVLPRVSFGEEQERAEPVRLDPVAMRLARSVAAVFQQVFVQRWSRALEKEGMSPGDWLRIWTVGFQAAGLREVDVKRALDRIYEERFKWPPQLLEFLALADIVVDFEGAFREAQRNMAARRAGFDPNWSHAFLFWAAQHEFNPVRFPELPYSEQVEKQWMRAVRRWQFRNCEPIPVVARDRMLPRPGGAHSNEVRRAELAKALSKIKAVDGAEVVAAAVYSLERLEEKLGKMSDK